MTEEHRFTLFDSVLAEVDAIREREEALRAASLPKDPKLGHRSSHTPKLALSEYLSDSGEAPPSMVHRGLPRGYTDVLGNDSWGDCAEAMTVHGTEGVEHAAGNAVPPFVTSDALALYTEVTGFDEAAGPPGSNPTDNGTDNDTLAEKMRSVGLRCAADGSVHMWGATVAVDATNTRECQIAIYEFAALYCAWALPISAQGQNPWDVVGDGETGDSAPASWGYHDTVALAYTGGTLDVNTWGVYTPVTERFRLAYQAGFFAALTREMLNRRGVSPTGLDYSRLAADLAKL